MEEINVLVTMPFPPELIGKLADVSPRLKVVQHEARSSEDLPQEQIDAVDVIYTQSALPNPELAPKLQWVQLHSAGINHIVDSRLYTNSDVTITTASGIHSVNMAEYVLAQMLALGHHIPKMIEDKEQKHWPRKLDDQLSESRWERYVPQELRDRTLGVVGYGSVGREIARLAQAFGMQILAIKRDLRNLEDMSFRLEGTGDPKADIPERIYPVAALHSFLTECDVVVLTTPLTSETTNLIDAQALNAMRNDALLINVSRGGIIAEADLVNALQEGEIGGAALDVFQEEPLPDTSPLWELPNVILSPHVSGFTPHYDDRATDLFAENLRRFIVGEDLINVVDRKRGY